MNMRFYSNRSTSTYVYSKIVFEVTAIKKKTRMFHKYKITTLKAFFSVTFLKSRSRKNVKSVDVQ